MVGLRAILGRSRLDSEFLVVVDPALENKLHEALLDQGANR